MESIRLEQGHAEIVLFLTTDREEDFVIDQDLVVSRKGDKLTVKHNEVSEEIAIQNGHVRVGLILRPLHLQVFLAEEVQRFRPVMKGTSLFLGQPLSVFTSSNPTVTFPTSGAIDVQYPSTLSLCAHDIIHSRFMPRLCFVIGAGPIGLAAALLLKKNGFLPVVIEKNSALTNFERKQVLGLEERSYKFLTELGLAENLFTNNEGWYYIRINSLQEALYNISQQLPDPVSILWETVFYGYKDTHLGAFIECRKTKAYTVHYPFKILVGADGGGSVTKGLRDLDGESLFTPSYLENGLWAIVTFLRSNCEKIYSGSFHLKDESCNYGTWQIRAYPTASKDGHRQYYIAMEPSDSDTFALHKNLGDLVEARKELDAENAQHIRNLVNKVAARLDLQYEDEYSEFNLFSASVALVQASTIKLPRSNAVITIQGDAAHKANFITGSGANAGFNGLSTTLNKFLKELQNKDATKEDIDEKNDNDRSIATGVFEKGLQFAPYLRVQNANGMALILRNNKVELAARGPRGTSFLIKIPPKLEISAPPSPQPPGFSTTEDESQTYQGEIVNVDELVECEIAGKI